MENVFFDQRLFLVQFEKAKLLFGWIKKKKIKWIVNFGYNTTTHTVLVSEHRSLLIRVLMVKCDLSRFLCCVWFLCRACVTHLCFFLYSTARCVWSSYSPSISAKLTSQWSLTRRRSGKYSSIHFSSSSPWVIRKTKLLFFCLSVRAKSF